VPEIAQDGAWVKRQNDLPRCDEWDVFILRHALIPIKTVTNLRSFKTGKRRSDSSRNSEQPQPPQNRVQSCLIGIYLNTMEQRSCERREPVLTHVHVVAFTTLDPKDEMECGN
jgi:hypothetical protein